MFDCREHAKAIPIYDPNESIDKLIGAFANKIDNVNECKSATTTETEVL